MKRASLTIEKREIEAALDDVKKRMRQVDEHFIEAASNEGVQSVKLGDGTNVHLRSQTWASIRPEAKESTIERMKQNDNTAFLVAEGVHGGKLSAYVRECQDNGGVPEWLEPLLKITDKVEVRVT